MPYTWPSQPYSFFAELLQHVLRISDMNRESLGSIARAMHTSPLALICADQLVDIFEQPDIFAQPDILEQPKLFGQLKETLALRYEAAGRTAATAAAAARQHRNPHLAATSNDHVTWQWLQVCSCCPLLLLVNVSSRPPPTPPPPPPPGSAHVCGIMAMSRGLPLLSRKGGGVLA